MHADLCQIDVPSYRFFCTPAQWVHHLLNKFTRVIVNSEIFVMILFLVNTVKRHICHIKSSQLGHNLPTSVNNGVI